MQDQFPRRRIGLPQSEHVPYEGGEKQQQNNQLHRISFQFAAPFARWMGMFYAPIGRTALPNKISGTVLILAALGQSVRAGDKKKFEIPKDAIAGTVKSVDEKGAKFTITLKSDKDRTFKVDAKTEFWSPKGGECGTGPKGWRTNAWSKATKSRWCRRKTRLLPRTCTCPTGSRSEEG
jgi:hypothetical protein